VEYDFRTLHLLLCLAAVLQAAASPELMQDVGDVLNGHTA
jgi:hypothetical protein